MESNPRFILLAPDLRFAGESSLYSGDTLEEKAHALSRAVAHSPIWDRMGRASLVLRPGVIPSLAALGSFDAADRARLEFLARWLQSAVGSLRFLDYPAVTSAVEELAERLLASVGPEVREFDFVGIPRGGLIVQGMLAYALDLDPERLGASEDLHRPLVVVDDCALTGSRFRRFISGSSREQTLFAHLCSTPELRERMVALEPSLSHSLAALDLRDLAPEEHGARYPEWRERVERQAGEGRYWIGETQIVVFPWNEPDHNFWNPVTEETEWGWRLVPPERCLKRGTSSHPEGIPLQVQSLGAGDFVPADPILYGRFRDAIHLLHSETGATLGLGEVGSLVWEGLMQGHSPDRIGDEVSLRYAVEGGRARADAEALLQDLLARGVLVRRTPVTDGHRASPE